MFDSRINKEGNIDYRLRINILHKYLGQKEMHYGSNSSLLNAVQKLYK